MWLSISFVFIPSAYMEMTFHALSDCILIFFDDLWFKLVFTVFRNINLHIAITDMHSFLEMTVSGIICFFIPIIILGIFQFFLHFLIQGAFQNN